MLAMPRVNSKATLKVPLESLIPLVPRVLHPQLRASRYITSKSQTLVIQSDESRKQASNVESCYEKLFQLLEAAAKSSIPGETSQQQKDRVRNLYDKSLAAIYSSSSHECTGSEQVTSRDSKPKNYTVARRAAAEVIRMMDNVWCADYTKS